MGSFITVIGAILAALGFLVIRNPMQLAMLAPGARFTIIFGALVCITIIAALVSRR